MPAQNRALATFTNQRKIFMKNFHALKNLLLIFYYSVFTIGQTIAQGVIAIDTASNTAYSGGWANGSNGGSGYFPWRLGSGTASGFFIGNPANNGMATTNIGTTAFGMFATGNQYAEATRKFSTPIKIGEELTFYWAMNWDANTGNKGFDLFGGGVKVFNINNAGSSNIVLDTSVSRKDTVLRTYGIRPMLIRLSRVDATKYTLKITSRDAAESSFVGTINSSQAIDSIKLYIGDQNDGNGNRNIYFNKFRIDTIATAPAVTTTNESSVTNTTAIIGGVVTDDGDDEVTARGVVWGTSSNPTLALTTKTSNGTGVGTYVSNLTGLTAGTLYYVRAYVINGVDTAYGNEITFTTTAPTAPTITTASVSGVTTNSAISGGNVTSDGGASIIKRGVVWSTSPNPALPSLDTTMNGTGTGSFVSNIRALASNVIYYVRAYAINSVDTAYGSELIFNTSTPPPPADTTTIRGKTIALDGARNTAYGGAWNDSSNGGSGYRPWDLTPGGSAGFFIGNPANDGMITTGIDTVAFGMFATGTQYANARRSFSRPMKVGDELTFYWAINFDANTGNKGFDIIANDTGKVFNLNNAGSQAIILDIPSVRRDTVLKGYGVRPMLVKLNRKDANSYTLSITSRDSTESTYTTTISSSLAINAMNLYIGDQRDTDGRRNIYFNKFRITSIDTVVTTPVLSTTAVTSVTNTGAVSGGNVSSDGGADVTARGVVWGTSENPTVSLTTKTSNGTGTGSFVSNLTGLTANTTYYVRAYAINSAGTAYGNELTFKTDTAAKPNPVVRTIANDSATNTAYGSGATRTWVDASNGGSGFRQWNLAPAGDGSAGFFIGNPANDGMGTAGIDTVAFGMYATGTQYANARRIFSSSMKVGDELTFYWAMNFDANTGNKGFDLLANDSVKVLNINNAGSSDILLDTGATAKVNLLRNYGTRPMLVTLNRKSSGSYTLTITGKDAAEPTYSGTISSSLAINAMNLYIGDQRDADGRRNIYFNKFKITSSDTSTNSNLPKLTTTAVTQITGTSARSGGNISNNGGTAVIKRGVVWSTSPSPTIDLTTKTSNGVGIGNFTSNLTGLSPNTTYYVRAYATNSSGTAYGNEITFTTTATSITNLEYKEGLKVYPNPVAKGASLQLEFNNLKAGKYSVSIYSLSGMRLNQFVLMHTGTRSLQNLMIPSTLSPGIYFAEITGGAFRENLKLIVQ